MTTAGDETPGWRGATRMAGPHRDRNATDAPGHLYPQPGRDAVSPFFAGPFSAYVTRGGGSDPVSVLQAGCLAPLGELGIRGLAQRGFPVSVTVTDEDTPLTRRILAAAGDAYDGVVIGDLRTVAVPQRAFDIVYCGRLLERVQNVELVLDHLTGALKPGGLLMIRMADRMAASALLDRKLPGPARRRLWRKSRPGTPGPFPAVYEKSVSEQGIYSFATMRGLVIAQHATEPTLRANPARLSSTVRAACAVISRLTRGRFTGDHDELLYVIRKPQDRFARVV